MVLRIVRIFAHPSFESWRRRGKVTLGQFDLAAGEGGPALVVRFWGIARLKLYDRQIVQNLFRGGIVALQHGHVPARQSHLSTRIKGGWNVFQNASARDGIAIPKQFDVSKLNFGINIIWRELQVSSRSLPAERGLTRSIQAVRAPLHSTPAR